MKGQIMVTTLYESGEGADNQCLVLIKWVIYKGLLHHRFGTVTLMARNLIRGMWTLVAQDREGY